MHSPSHKDNCDIKTPFQQVSELPCFAVSVLESKRTWHIPAYSRIKSTVFSIGPLKAHEVCKSWRGPPHSFMVCQQFPYSGCSFPKPSSLPSTFSHWKKPSLPFLFTSYKFTCSMLLAWWKGQAPALPHIHRGLAWHIANLVTGEVALPAGAPNCFRSEYFWPPFKALWLCWMQHITNSLETKCPV